ncbi:MAG: hypothetical protein JXP34_24945 [Planctomycetes bacterium]|nr:hypothetical protein [Planctomycetota bacterium]
MTHIRPAAPERLPRAPIVVLCFALGGATAAAGEGPAIEVWYGENPRFGTLGVPQHWINILGNVSDPDGILSLTYSLAGGPEQPLARGPDTRRLLAPGDFNVEIAATDLHVGPNPLAIRATDALGNETVRRLDVGFTAATIWPLPYSIDWSAAPDIPSVAQVVDGRWTIGPQGVRPLALGYDRLVALGDLAWTDYEVTVPVTVHSVYPGPYGLPAGMPGVGLVLRWTGHTENPPHEEGMQPRIGYTPLGTIAWCRYYVEPSGGSAPHPLLTDSAAQIIAIAPSALPPLEGRTYIFRASVRSEAGGPRYALDVWEQGQPEDSGASIQALDTTAPAPASGCILLIAHLVDASFGDTIVEPIGAPPPPPALSGISVETAARTAVIAWTTQEPRTSRVEYGVTPSYEMGAVRDATPVTAHRLTLSMLACETTYHFRISSVDGNGESVESEDLLFSTPPCRPEACPARRVATPGGAPGP